MAAMISCTRCKVMPLRCSSAKGWPDSLTSIKRPVVRRLGMHLRLEAERRRPIDAKVIAEPAEARLLIGFGVAIEQLLGAPEAGRRLRHPNTPNELVLEPDNRDLQAPSDEEVPVGDAEIR